MKGMYVVFDKIAQECGSISYYNNDEQAQRSYPSAFKEGMKEMYKDFMLVKVGEIDLHTMKITTLEIPEDVTPEFVE